MTRKNKKMIQKDKNIDPKRAYLDKRPHFYWTQKKPSIARSIYQEKCNQEDIIMDPFLGSGSSLYGISDSKYKFIGVEINEQPLMIAKFNLKKLDSNSFINIKSKIIDLEGKFGELYIYNTSKNEKLTFEKIIYDNRDNPIVKKIIFTDSRNKSVTSDQFPETITEFTNRYLNAKQSIDGLDNLNLIKNSRIAVKDNMKLSDVFSPINYLILSKIKEQIIDDDMKHVLGSVLHLCKLTDTRSQSQFPYWIPKAGILDRNIFTLLKKKLISIEKTHEELGISLTNNYKELIKAKTPTCLLLNIPSQKVGDHIPDNSIDFVLTDPPYFDQVAYSEYLKIWEFFLGYKSVFEDEIVVSQRNNYKSTLADYLENLKIAFLAINRALKLNKEMWIYFKDSRLDKMSSFIEIVTSCGFEFLGQRHVGVKKYTYKQNTSIKSTINGESILIFKKNNTECDYANSSSSGLHEAQELIKTFVSTYLVKEGNASLGKIVNDGLVKFLYDNKALDYLKKSKELISLIEEVADYNNVTREYSIKK